MQLLTLLEGAIKRDHLSSNFETTNELLSSAKVSAAANGTSISGSVPVLPWIPDTAAAVALRLLELDASISYIHQQKAASQKGGESRDFFVSFISICSLFMIINKMEIYSLTL